MQAIQTDMSESILADAIRGNLVDFFRYLAQRLPAGDGFENEKFSRWFTHLAHPWFRGVVCSAGPDPDDARFFQDTVQYFNDRQVDVFTCWLETGLARADWESFLAGYGFQFSGDTPGMAIDLQSLPQSAPSIKGLEIQVVEDETAMKDWAHIFTIGYGMPPDWESTIFEVWYKLGLDFPIRNYLGYLDGESVSTSTVFYARGVAGIYDVATLPKARGQGLGTALTLAPLLDARQAGYRIGILQSSEMGFSVYKKMGFRHLCQIENFYHKR